MNTPDIYIDWDRTPKKWHYFMCIVSIFAALMNFNSFMSDYNVFASYPETKESFLELGIYWPLVAIMVGSAAIGIIMVVAFIGLLKRKWFGPVLLIAAYIVSIGRNIIYEAVILTYPTIFEGMGSEIIGYTIGSAVLVFGNWVYYKKRRALFSPAQKAKTVYREHKCKKQKESMEQKSGEDGPGENCVVLLEQLRDEAEKDTSKKESKKSKEMKIILLFLVMFIASTITSSSIAIYQHNKLSEQGEKINLAEEELSKLNSKYESALSARRIALNEKEELQRELDETKKDTIAFLDELMFWRRYAVIVTEYGEKYHTYKCQYIENKEFWIYNVDNAIYKGYTPCSVCNPPTW